MFDRCELLFPVKKNLIYLNNCGIAPMYGPAARAGAQFMEVHSSRGSGVFSGYVNILGKFHEAAARLFGTGPENISFVKNTAEGFSMIANGYPLQPGDEIISYIHEYPSNHYPWKLQEKRGVVLRLVGDTSKEKPVSWTLEALEELCSKKTKIIAVSHVQFTSGFAADMEELGNFCHERKIDLVIDAAQSLGALPLEAVKWKISAVASSGWKWLLGPIGTGILYTSPEFREKIALTMTGADLMKQGQDYLNHSWQPYSDGQKFEYSTSPVSLCVALEISLSEIVVRYGINSIRSEIFRLQNIFLKQLDRNKYSPLEFPEKNRSGILSLSCKKDPVELSARLLSQSIAVTSRGGYLRIAPHFYNTDEDMKKAAEAVNSL